MMGYDHEDSVQWYKCFNGCGHKEYINSNSKLTAKQISVNLFNIVSSHKYNMNDLAPMFNEIDYALTRLEKIESVIKELNDKGMFKDIYMPQALNRIETIVKGEY